MRNTLSLVFALCIYSLGMSQYQIGLVPRSSPDKAISQKIGYTDVKITYGSPSVKDRKIWGDLVPYNEVWRAGANDATTVEFSTDVVINGTTLDSGKYSFFIIPKENDKWVAVFNKVAKQWGAFRYDAEEDALRFPFIPRLLTHKKENLTYQINQLGFQYGSIQLQWGFIECDIPFETNYIAAFISEVENRASKQPDYLAWVVYIQGAEHLLEMNVNLDAADRWLKKAEGLMSNTTEWNAQFYPRDYVTAHLYWTKAKLLSSSENYKDALSYVSQLKTLENQIFYDRKNDVESIDILSNEWASKKE